MNIRDKRQIPSYCLHGKETMFLKLLPFDISYLTYIIFLKHLFLSSYILKHSILPVTNAIPQKSKHDMRSISKFLIHNGTPANLLKPMRQ